MLGGLTIVLALAPVLVLAAGSAAEAKVDRAGGSDTTVRTMSGTIDLTIETSAPDGSHSRSVFHVVLRGKVGPERAVPADVSVLEWDHVAYEYNPETGLDDACLRRNFRGFRDDENYPPGRVFVATDLNPLDVARKKTRGYLSIVPTYGYGVVGTGQCEGGADEYTDAMPLIAAVQAGEGASLVGGGLNQMDQQETYAPRWVTFRLRKGLWRSSGSRTTTASDYKTTTLRVDWDLRAARPVDRCVLPAAKSVRGETVPRVRTILARYGFDRTRVAKAFANGTPRGRVIGLRSPDFDGTAPCRGRVTIYVAG